MEIGKGKKVLAVHNKYLIPGGEDKSHKSEIKIFEYLGFEVLEYHLDNRNVQKLGKFRTALRSIWARKPYLDIDKILQNESIDLIIVQNFFPLISPSVFYAAKKNKIPIIQYLRNYRLICPSADLFRSGNICEKCLGRSFQLPSIKFKCYKNSFLGSGTVATMNFIHKILGTWNERITLYIALTEFAKDKYIEGGLPGHKIFIKPNFLYPDPGEGPHDEDYIIFIGRLSEEKGVKTLLDAWKMLDVETNLVIIGSGPLKYHIEQACEIDNRIRYLGNLPTEKVFKYLKKAKLLVFPSEWYEGMPRILIEAFATATPVISSNIGSMSSMIQHNRNGIHFKPGDVNDLEKVLRVLNNNRVLRHKIGTQARKDYLKHYTRSANLIYLQNLLGLVLK